MILERNEGAVGLQASLPCMPDAGSPEIEIGGESDERALGRSGGCAALGERRKRVCPGSMAPEGWRSVTAGVETAINRSPRAPLRARRILGATRASIGEPEVTGASSTSPPR